MVVDVKADVYTYVVPNTVENADDHDKMYEVRLWGDYAMNDNTTNIQEVVFKNTLDYVASMPSRRVMVLQVLSVSTSPLLNLQRI